MQKRANAARALSRFLVIALSLVCSLAQPPHGTEPSLKDGSDLSSEVAVRVVAKIAVQASRSPAG
ncbi:hypothetical protein [Pseudomonas putida]|uniref:hypothetical protein n=1 Tax=Pseudomonas putida TaxID=303 RepID=UPI0015FFA059|nr:hypothetical protein [Pseudomonas putida]